MEKIAKNLQLILMCIILISTVIAVGIEIYKMYQNMSFICSSFGVKGLLPPIIAAWFPVVISLSGGFYSLRRTSM